MKYQRYERLEDDENWDEVDHEHQIIKMKDNAVVVMCQFKDDWMVAIGKGFMYIKDGEIMENSWQGHSIDFATRSDAEAVFHMLRETQGIEISTNTTENIGTLMRSLERLSQNKIRLLKMKIMAQTEDA